MADQPGNGTGLPRHARWVRRIPFDPIPGLIFLVGGAVLASKLSVVDQWHVMTDEMLYPKVAYDVLDGHLFPGWLRGMPNSVKNVLFPILIAPFLGTMRLPDAFNAIIALNAFLFAGASIPAFLIARQLMARWAAYLIAISVIAVPWAIHAGSVLTEATAYVAFVWALWAMHRCLVRPGPGSDLLVLGILLLAYLARTQLIVLVPLLPVAVVLHELTMGVVERLPGRSRLSGLRAGAIAAWRGHRLLVGVCAIGTLYVFSRGGISIVLGSYSVTATGDLLPEGIWLSTWQSIASIAIGLGAVPLAFACGWVLDQLRVGGRRPDHALAVLLLLVFPAMAVIATSFSLQYSGGFLQERYIFYIAPLILLGFGAFFAARRGLVITLIGTAAAAYVMTRLTYGGALTIAWASPETAFYPVVRGRSEQLAGLIGWSPTISQFLWVGMFATATAGVLALRRVGPKLFVVVGGALILWLGGQLNYLFPRVLPALANTSRVLGTQDPDTADWVDRATHDGDRVGVLDSAVNMRAGQAFFNSFFDRATLWNVEFWNKRIMSAWGINASAQTLQPTGLTAVDAQTGAISATGQRPVNHIVMSSSDVRLAPEGPLVAEQDVLSLYRTTWPLRAAWVSRGIGTDGWTNDGTPSIIRVFGGTGDLSRLWDLRVVGYAGADVPGGRTVSLRFGSGRDRTHVETTAELRARACVAPGEHLDARVIPNGASPLDTRLVGIRVIRIAATPGRPC